MTEQLAISRFRYIRVNTLSGQMESINVPTVKGKWTCPLLAHCLQDDIEKEYIWISSDEIDETGDDYTEWIKPERKTPIQYTNTYIWNLERWQWRPCMQDNKKDTDVYNGLLDSEGEGEGGMIWENGI